MKIIVPNLLGPIPLPPVVWIPNPPSNPVHCTSGLRRLPPLPLGIWHPSHTCGHQQKREEQIPCQGNHLGATGLTPPWVIASQMSPCPINRDTGVSVHVYKVAGWLQWKGLSTDGRIRTHWGAIWWPKHLLWISLGPHSNWLGWAVLVTSIHRWGNWGTERVQWVSCATGHQSDPRLLLPVLIFLLLPKELKCPLFWGFSWPQSALYPSQWLNDGHRSPYMSYLQRLRKALQWRWWLLGHQVLLYYHVDKPGCSPSETKLI